MEIDMQGLEAVILPRLLHLCWLLCLHELLPHLSLRLHWHLHHSHLVGLPPIKLLLLLPFRLPITVIVLIATATTIAGIAAIEVLVGLVP